MTDDLRLTESVLDGVHLLTVSGALYLRGVARLMATVAAALSEGNRTAVCDVRTLRIPGGPGMLTAFPAALRRAGGWPVASLRLVAGTGEAGAAVRGHLGRFVPVHDDLVAAWSAAATDVAQEHLRIEVPAELSSPRLVRDAVRELCPSGALCRDDAMVVADELACNAVRHTERPFTVDLSLSPTRLLVAVTDASRAEPVVRPPQAWTTSGRGMYLVSRLSQSWGVRWVHPAGKTVWATLGTRRPVPRARAAC